MASYLIRRILWIIPVLFAVSLITFTLMQTLTPGRSVGAGKAASIPDTEARLNAEYGLDKPWHEQYVDWVADFLVLDLGPSFRYVDRDVNAIVSGRLLDDFQLGVMAFALSVIVGIPLGIFAALGHNRRPTTFRPAYPSSALPRRVSCSPSLLVLVFSLGLNLRGSRRHRVDGARHRGCCRRSPWPGSRLPRSLAIHGRRCSR